MEKKQRIEYIDLMKGICIVLVVMQHGDVLPDRAASVLTRVYLSFNMPLFFFVSGLFLPVGKKAGEMVSGCVNRLLVPWIVFAVIGAIVVDVWVRGNVSHLTSPRAIADWLMSYPNIPLYFLRALCVATMVAWVLARRFRSLPARSAVLCVLITLSWLAFEMSPVVHEATGVVRFVVNSATLTESFGRLMYLWLGFMIADTCSVSSMRVSRGVGVAVFILALVAAMALNPPCMRWHYVETQGPWWIVTVSALLGVTAVWGLSNALCGLRIAALAGRYSIVILVTHYILLYAIADGLGIDKQRAVVGVFLVQGAVVWACVRWLPWACAQRRLVEWRDGRLRPASWLTAQINRVKSGIAEYFT